MSRVSELQTLVESVSSEMEKFYEKGNKAAGTRARKGLQDLKKISSGHSSRNSSKRRMKANPF